MTDGDGEAQPAPGPAEEAEVEEGDDSKEGEGAKDGEEAKDGVDGVDGEDGKKKKKEKKEKKAKVVKDEKMGQVKHEDLDWLFIGGAEDAKDREALEKHSIRYILNCTPVRSNGGVANVYEKDPKFEYCRVSMGDNATETLQSRMEASWVFLEKARIREDGSVLIHCQQGVSRSVSMAMSYMMKYYRKSFEEALGICKDARSQACPNEGFTTQLKALDEELRSNPKLYEPVPPKRGKAYRTNGRPVGAAVRMPALWGREAPLAPAWVRLEGQWVLQGLREARWALRTQRRKAQGGPGWPCQAWRRPCQAQEAEDVNAVLSLGLADADSRARDGL
eukprot:CAMPEP_0181454602 /NCGR_PEP_ID=MMETSP1110-20121109/30324_1 /TAXON_ID=174948 /ORGANISM="Symbiodinium sp., Strain CCMP421" /LENGTH=333 /DNA_ID=CAMNT_0023578955 /DNA_START=24 /DNA_END=1022 /DNA_ORIENTATION=+